MTLNPFQAGDGRQRGREILLAGAFFMRDVLNGIRASTNVQVVANGQTNTIASVVLENSAHAGVAWK